PAVSMQYLPTVRCATSPTPLTWPFSKIWGTSLTVKTLASSENASQAVRTLDAKPMNHRRYLIVNADDLGYSHGVNRGILEAHSSGIVTSASLMVRWPATTDAVLAARDCPGLSLGLHLDLGEWACRNGQWV